MGATTTGAPSYSTGQTNPLSLTLAGALRVDASATTQPISGTITANQGGTWTVQPGNTANTTAWLVTGSGGTFPATQSGTWNITNISGTISLPTGAATSANQPSNIGQGATTSTQTGTLAMGLVTTGNPTYTTGQINGLSLDTSGALRVNVIAGSGGGGTSSSFGSAFPATGTAIGVKDSAGTNMTFLQVNASNALKVDGSAVTQPVSGTFWQATQPVSIAASVTVQQATAANLNATVTGTVAATQSGNWTSRIVGNAGSTLDTVASNNAAMPSNMLITGGVFNTSPGSITTGSAGVLQLNSTGSLRVDGSLVTQPVSGTFWQATQPVSIAAAVTVQQSTAANLKGQVDPLTAANWGIGSSTQNSATVANGHLVLGQYNLSPASITSTNMSPLQLDSVGNLRVTINASNASIAATQSGAWNVGQVGGPWTQNLTQLNSVALGSPSNYGTSPGAVSVAGVNAFITNTPAVSQSGTWNIGTVTTLTGITNNVNVNTHAVTQSGLWTVGGDTANASADANNPVKIGGVARLAVATLPTAVTSGQRVNASFDKQGRQICIGATRECKGDQKTSISTTTETTIITAGGAGVFNDLYGILVCNKSATTVFIDIRDTTAGSVMMTLAAPASDMRGFTLTIDSAMAQTTANTNWTATLSGAASSIEITAFFVQTT